MIEKPTPPRGLSATAKRVWLAVCEEFDLDAASVDLLTAYAEACARREQARAVLQKEGITFIDKHEQPRAHPCIAIERDAANTQARLARLLGIHKLTETKPTSPGFSHEA